MKVLTTRRRRRRWPERNYGIFFAVLHLTRKSRHTRVARARSLAVCSSSMRSLFRSFHGSLTRFAGRRNAGWQLRYVHCYIFGQLCQGHVCLGNDMFGKYGKSAISRVSSRRPAVIAQRSAGGALINCTALSFLWYLLSKNFVFFSHDYIIRTNTSHCSVVLSYRGGPSRSRVGGGKGPVSLTIGHS